MNYYPAFICENGHAISTASHLCPDRHCSKCGARIISKCPICDNTIKGRADNGDPNAMIFKYTVPAYCRHCGKPYPWTAAAIESASVMIAESELSTNEQQKLISVLPDIVTETPRTQLASSRIKRAMACGDGFIAEGLRDFVINLGCEAAKHFLGLL